MARSPLLLALLVGQAVAAPAEAPELPLLPRGDGHSCTRDGRWCVGLEEPDKEGVVRPVIRATEVMRKQRQPPRNPSGVEAHTVWPVLIPFGDGRFLAGVQSLTGTGYSGGGGGITGLRLYRASAAGIADVAPVLDLPMKAILTIRACFNEQDRRNRRGACHDEYRFDASLHVVPGGGGEWPELAYVTEATAFPRGVSQTVDSTRMAPLAAQDLVRQHIGRCSFKRRFRYDVSAGLYRPDAPLPDCSDYTEP